MWAYADSYPDLIYGSTRNGSAFRINSYVSPDVSPSRSASTSYPDDVGLSSFLDFHNVDDEGYTSNLREIVDLLTQREGLRMFKIAYRRNMLFKRQMYADLLERANKDVQKQIDIIGLKIPELKRLAKVSGDHDNWVIFDSISDAYKEAKSRATVFEERLQKATDRLSGTMSKDEVQDKDTIKELRDRLVTSLRNLSNFASQSHVVYTVVDIVGTFIKDPRLVRTKMLNLMLMGGAGTGKTTIAQAIAQVFANAGIFVGDQVKEAGRAEFIGQYEGQTVARTREFLLQNLDSGVVFVDEAYAITPWERGKPEGYGSEAASAMIEFMTRYKGLFCIIVAGYEKEMLRYFLPTNEGLSRRFPHKFVLSDMSADDMVRVFQRQILIMQDIKPADGSNAPLESQQYFSPQAWEYLRRLIEIATEGDKSLVEEEDTSTRKRYKDVVTFSPKFPYVYQLFSNQAGSMTNLADEAVRILMSRVDYKNVAMMQKKNAGVDVQVPIPMQGVETMKMVVVHRILNMALSLSYLFMEELEKIHDLIK